MTNDELQATVDAVRRLGSNRAAARELGVDEGTIRYRMKQATKAGLTGDFHGQHVEGFSIKGVSTLYDGSGEIKAQWVKTSADAEQLAAITDMLLDGWQKELTPLPPVELKWGGDTDPDLICVIPIADLHLGMLAWAKETGASYDSKIASDMLKQMVGNLIAHAPNAETAVVLNLGDFFHANNDDAETAKSHNKLDVDGRFDKTLHMGWEVLQWVVDMALQRFPKVVVRTLPGNHDGDAARALTLATWVRYQDNPRVTVDRTPGHFFFLQHGKVMLAATHGDMVKAEQMPGVMAAYEPKMWGDTEFRYALTGHIHHRKRGPIAEEHAGAEYESFQTIASKDSWARAMGHSSGRSMSLITYHKDKGRVSVITENVYG